MVNQRVIDVGLVSEVESVKKYADPLEVGFQQSSIEMTLASAICVAKQMGRFKTRKTSIAAKLSDASKMQHSDTTVGTQIALTSKTDALLNLQVSAIWIQMKEPISFLGSSLYGAAASEKNRGFVTHLLKSKQFEIAVMPPEQLALEVLMEKYAFVAWQRCNSLSVPRLAEQSWRGGDGEADEASEFGSEEPAKRERSSRPLPASSWRGRVNSWTTWVRSTAGSLRSSRHRRKVSRWNLAGETHWFCSAMVPFCDKYAIDIKAKGFGQIWLNIFMSAALSTWSRRRRGEMLKESLRTLRP